MQIDRLSPKAVYEQIAGDVRRQILEGLLAPYARIETEAALRKRYGVSRATVAQAMALLARDGLIVRRRAKGTFVAGPRVRHDLSQLSGFYDALVAQGQPFTTMLREFRLVPADERVRATLQEDRAMLLERLYLVDTTPIAISHIHMTPAARSVSHAQAESQPCYAILRDLLGRTIARADIAIRAERAPGPIAQALGLQTGEPVLVLDRVSFDPAGTALETSLFFVRPEAYEFTISVSDGIAVTRSLRSRDRYTPEESNL